MKKLETNQTQRHLLITMFISDNTIRNLQFQVFSPSKNINFFLISKTNAYAYYLM